MLILLSPSKKLDEKSSYPNVPLTTPEFLGEAEQLAAIMKKKSEEDIANLMGLSEKLSQLNYERYQKMSFPFTEENARPALYTFKGDVYDKMDVESYTEEDLNFAGDHIRILSGLYGLLKPMDLMQPYRLEMGTSLENKKGKNLYSFWGSDLAVSVNKSGEDIVVNLASNEYFTAMPKKALVKPVLNINFKHLKNGKLKTIGLMAKRARGLMANYVIKNKITDVEKLKDFNEEGYIFIPESSSESEYTFVLDMDK